MARLISLGTKHVTNKNIKLLELLNHPSKQTIKQQRTCVWIYIEEIEADLERETAVVLQAVTEELDRFNTNQVKGIKSVLLEYGRIQQQYCRKNLAYWTEMKLACDDVDTTMMTSSTFILQ
eukprot:m.110480 g.110480  ORF g.110480 m.110480 type:complete len:121 (-) comp28045_c0_seq2:80-442(-)